MDTIKRYSFYILGVLLIYLFVEGFIVDARQFDDFSAFGKAVAILFAIGLVLIVVTSVVLAVIGWIVKKIY